MSIIKRTIIGLFFVTILGLSFFMYSNYIGFFSVEGIKRPIKVFFNQKNIFLEYTKKHDHYLNNVGQEKADALIHQELIKTFRDIFVGEILTRYSENIKYCSWFTEDYEAYFTGFDDLKIKKFKVQRTGINRAICKVTYTNQEISNLDEYENFDIKNLVKKFKIVNYTQKQLNEAKYSNFILYVRNQDEFFLKRIHHKWYIYKLKYNILHSRLKLIKPVEY